MPRDIDQKSNRIGSKSVIRLIIFLAVIYFSIFYLSRNFQKKEMLTDPTVLGQEIETIATPQLKPFFDQIYQSLPQDSRQKIENTEQIPAIIYIREKYDDLKDQVNGFPQRQINQLKKEIIQSVYDDLMQGINQDQPTNDNPQ